MDKLLYDQIEAIEDSHWWYVARRKIIFDSVFNILDSYVTPSILDLGCGTGYNIDYMKQAGYTNCLGLDFTFDALKYCKNRDIDDVVCADTIQIPFADNSFDVITSLDMIEHIEDDSSAIREMHRVLKPGGQLIIFTPAYQFLWGLQDEISHHYRRYTAHELKKKTENQGFIIDRITYTNTLLFPVVFLGRMMMRLQKTGDDTISENDLHPSWSNDILQNIFASEQYLLRYIDLPFGVSILMNARKFNLK